MLLLPLKSRANTFGLERKNRLYSAASKLLPLDETFYLYFHHNITHIAVYIKKCKKWLFTDNSLAKTSAIGCYRPLI